MCVANFYFFLFKTAASEKMGQERILIAPPRDGAAHEKTDADAVMDDDGAQRSKGGGMKKAKVQHYSFNYTTQILVILILILI